MPMRTLSPGPQPTPAKTAPSLAVPVPSFASERGQPSPRSASVASRPTARFQLPLVRPDEPNRTGLPDRLKHGLERTSGLDLSDLRVHRNSPWPVWSTNDKNVDSADDYENLVPMSRTMNVQQDARGSWKEIEEKILTSYKANKSRSWKSRSTTKTMT